MRTINTTTRSLVEAKLYLVRDPVIRIYRIMAIILLLVLSFAKKIPDSDSMFLVTGHSPDQRRSTLVEVVTHDSGQHCVHACSGGEGCADQGLHKALSVSSSSCFRPSGDSSILTFIASRFTRLLSRYAIATVTMSGDEGCGDGTGGSDSRNPTATMER